MHQIQRIKVNQQKLLGTFDMQKYQIGFSKFISLLEINAQNVNEHIKIMDGVVDVNKIKLKKLAEIEEIEKQIINELTRAENKTFFYQLLDDFLKNELKTVSDKNLLSGKLLHGENSNLPTLPQNLVNLSFLYKDIGISLSREQILVKLISDANYENLIRKEKNLLVLKTMSLLKEAFDHI